MYFTDQTLGETILKQSLVKGLFPRLSYQRGKILQQLKQEADNKKAQQELKKLKKFKHDTNNNTNDIQE